MTLYVTSTDWALPTSEILRGRVRCGRVAAVYEGVDTLDTTGMEKGEGVLARWSSGWNHNDLPPRPCGTATNAILVPSGESAGAPPSMSGANE